MVDVIGQRHGTPSGKQPIPKGKGRGKGTRSRSAAGRASGNRKTVADAAGAADGQMADYEVLRELGRGSSGVAMLVRRRSDKALLAMKSIALAPLFGADTKAGNVRTQAMREVEIMRELDSPHVVRYAGAVLLPATSKRPHAELNIFTEYCNGGDLAAYTRRLGAARQLRLPERIIWQVAAAMAAGLHELHKRQILHRDLKPANIFLQRPTELSPGRAANPLNDPKDLQDAVVKVGDLGMARSLSNAESLASTLVGTPYYCAPEVFNGDAYGTKADIYSLGACIFELMHGKPPHGEITNIAALVNKLLNLAPQGGEETGLAMDDCYSAQLQNVVRSCLARLPEDRPATEQLLQQLQQGPPKQAFPGACRAKTPSPRKSRGCSAGSHAGVSPRGLGVQVRARSASPSIVQRQQVKGSVASPPLAPRAPLQNGAPATDAEPRGVAPFKFQPLPRSRSAVAFRQQKQEISLATQARSSSAGAATSRPALEQTLIRTVAASGDQRGEAESQRGHSAELTLCPGSRVTEHEENNRKAGDAVKVAEVTLCPSKQLQGEAIADRLERKEAKEEDEAERASSCKMDATASSTLEISKSEISASATLERPAQLMATPSGADLVPEVDDAAVHSKRFLQENRWRSASRGHGPRPKQAPSRDAVVDYVARAQEYWMRWRQERRQMKASADKATAADSLGSLEIKGAAFCPPPRPRHQAPQAS